MDVREKLVEFLNNSFAEQYEKRGLLTAPHTATELIAHGVTVQEWISVKDRLPEPKKLVLCIWKDINGVHYGFSRYQYDNVWYVSNEGMPEVTHWMALPKKPQPPKGE